MCRLALADGVTTVIGGPQTGDPFRDVTFAAIAPVWFLPLSANHRYAYAVARRLRALRPALIEVHNRPEIALALAARRPDVPVTLVLHNDPPAMRQAATPAQRAALLRRMALVMTPSAYLRDRLLEGVGNIPRPPVVVPNCIDLTELPPPRPRENLILFAGRVVDNKAPDAFVAACATALPTLPGWHAQIIGADRFRARQPRYRLRHWRPRHGRTCGRADARLSRPPRRSGGHGSRCHRRGAQPLAGTIRPCGAGGAGQRRGADLLATRRHCPKSPAMRPCTPTRIDPEEIAAAIRALAGDPARRAALAEAGRARVKRFDVALVRDQLAAVRRSVCAGRIAPPGG